MSDSRWSLIIVYEPQAPKGGKMHGNFKYHLNLYPKAYDAVKNADVSEAYFSKNELLAIMQQESVATRLAEHGVHESPAAILDHWMKPLVSGGDFHVLVLVPGHNVSCDAVHKWLREELANAAMIMGKRYGTEVSEDHEHAERLHDMVHNRKMSKDEIADVLMAIAGSPEVQTLNWAAAEGPLQDAVREHLGRSKEERLGYEMTPVDISHDQYTYRTMDGDVRVAAGDQGWAFDNVTVVIDGRMRNASGSDITEDMKAKLIASGAMVIDNRLGEWDDGMRMRYAEANTIITCCLNEKRDLVRPTASMKFMHDHMAGEMDKVRSLNEFLEQYGAPLMAREVSTMGRLARASASAYDAYPGMALGHHHLMPYVTIGDVAAVGAASYEEGAGAGSETAVSEAEDYVDVVADEAGAHAKRGKGRRGRGRGKKGGPKRPRNAYILWMSENRQRLADKVRKSSAGAYDDTKTMDLAGQEWRAMPDAERQVWLDKAAAEAQAYHEAKAAYEG